MLIDLLLLCGGLALLVMGGEFLVRGASAMARSFGVSPLIVGLTIVAFGTSAPELVVNVQACLERKPQFAFGNIIGSNIANVGLIVGLTAIVRAMSVDRQLVKRELPYLIVASLATLVMCLDGALERSEAILLLLGFVAMLVFTFNRQGQLGADTSEDEPVQGSRVAQIALMLAGLLGLVYGADLAVASAEALALSLDVPEAVIALSIVSVGTSLPELTTALVAVLRGHDDLAIGNVVGSNLFNLLLVMGASGFVADIPVPPGGYGDITVAIVFSALLIPFSLTGKKIVRWEAALLFAGYVGYLIWAFKR